MQYQPMFLTEQQKIIDAMLACTENISDGAVIFCASDGAIAVLSKCDISRARMSVSCDKFLSLNRKLFPTRLDSITTSTSTLTRISFQRKDSFNITSPAPPTGVRHAAASKTTTRKKQHD
jgi:hypothetical protein